MEDSDMHCDLDPTAHVENKKPLKTLSEDA